MTIQIARPAAGHPRRTGASVLVLIGAALACATTVSAQVIDAPNGINRAAVVHHAGQMTVRSGDTVQAQIELPESHKIRSITELRDGWIVAGYRPGADGNELFLKRILRLSDDLEADAEGGATTVREIPLPKRVTDAGAISRVEPIVLSFDGELDGLVWLEGRDSRTLAVRAARWKDGRWTAIRTLSAPPERGSQLALSAAVLADGSWLATWSRFDGNDDEIVFSRLSPAGWTKPLRVARDNDVPDITPSLHAVGAGAIATWSRYDGNDYRVVTARYRNGLWSAPQEVGEPGSLFPKILQRDNSTLVMYRTVVPQTWSLIEFDGRGQERQRTAVRSQRKDRPLLLDHEAGVRLAWPGDSGTGLGASIETAWGEKP